MNVTPLIDVLLVLLVIFMLINLLRLRLVQDLPLPRPSAGESAPSTQIVLELRADGTFAVNRQPVPSGQLAAYLKDAFARRPSKLLFIRADTARTYQDVIAAMDLARGAGIEGIALVPVGRAERG
jgi:biopolymer transport protein ExbD